MKRRTKTGRPTLEQVEALLGPATEWAGRCYEVAKACVDAGLVDGVAVYGHFVGKIHPRSYFAHRSRLSFVRHGWVKLRDGKIFDPTRWAFTAEEPFLFFGPDDPSEYDEGGNQLRKVTTPPEFRTTDQCFVFGSKIIKSEAWLHVWGLLGRSFNPKVKMGWVSLPQLFWLANLPYESLQPHAWDIYQAFKLIKREALVPIDNYRRAEREEATK